MIGTVAAQMTTAGCAIFTATMAHPERHGALLTGGGTAREVHATEATELEGDWTATAPVRRLIHAARLAIASGSAETAVAYVDAIHRRWRR